MFIIFSHLPYRLILQPPSQVKEGVQQLVTLQNPHVAPQAPCKSSESMGIYGLYGDFGCQVQSKTLQLKTSNLWTSHENFSIDERKLPWPDLCGGCCGVKRTNHWSAQVHAWGQGVWFCDWICRKYQGVTPSKSLWHLRVARSLLWSYTHRNSLLVLATVTVSGGSSETPVGWQVWTPSHIRHLHSVQEVEKLVKQFKTKSDREAEQNRSLGLVEIDMSSIFPYSMIIQFAMQFPANSSCEVADHSLKITGSCCWASPTTPRRLP